MLEHVLLLRLQQAHIKVWFLGQKLFLAHKELAHFLFLIVTNVLEHEHHRVEELCAVHLVGVAASHIRLLKLEFVNELRHQEPLKVGALLKQFDQEVYVLGVCIVNILREISLHLFGEVFVLGAIGPVLFSYHDERVYQVVGPNPTYKHSIHHNL